MRSSLFSNFCFHWKQLYQSVAHDIVYIDDFCVMLSNYILVLKVALFFKPLLT